jgi:glycosyltransferase involved in cell wall biosynthesis
MRVLFVGFSDSVHAAHWVSLVADQGWDLHFFPAEKNPHIHPDLRNVTVWSEVARRHSPDAHRSVRVKGLWPAGLGERGHRYLARLAPHRFDRAELLARVIARLRPDIVHSMELQHAGYLTLAAKSRSRRPFPPWLASNWGCDIHLYGRLPEHRTRIVALLRECDFYSCECDRDVVLARQLGFTGEVLPVAPNSGGLDLATIARLGKDLSPSSRRVIAVKGYHGHMHRAQVALHALALCADRLAGYQIRVFSAHPRDIIEMQAQLVAQETGLDIELMPRVSHEAMLHLHNSARLSISLSLSDGICTSMLEAMAMGSFPIQSWTACADEWIENGVSGFLVPPEDPDVIAERIRAALLGDELVDKAAARNADTIRRRADRATIQELVRREYYRRIHAFARDPDCRGVAATARG